MATATKLGHRAGPVEPDEILGVVQRCLRCDCVVSLPDEPSGIEYELGERAPGLCPGKIVTPYELATADAMTA